MASNSKSINLGGANVYVQRCVLTAWFNENSTSTANNTSNITCRASLYTPSAAWNNGSGRNDNLRIYWHDNRENYDRLVATWSGSAVDVGQTITAEGTINATHKDDGTLSGYAYATWSRDGGNANYAPASGGVATDWTGLTTIARASQPTIGQANTNVPDFNIGDTITIYMNRKSNSFTHTVTFNYGHTSVQVATGVTNSCTFDTSTIANELYALIPNDNVYSNTISVKTYNGSTLIGTKTCAYNAHVVNSNPIIPTGSPANEYYYLNARDTLTRTVFSNNQFIQNISQVDCIVNKTNAMPTAQNGASLVKVICAFAGLTGEILAEDIPTSEGSFSITLGKPTTYGTQTAQLTAIDSRGNSTTVVVDAYTGQLVGTGLNYIAQYSAPSIVASCERQSNFENDTTISISGAMTSLKRYNENTECNAVNATNGIQYRYKESTSSTWGAWKNVRSTTSADGSVSTTAFVISLDNQKEWDFEFKITDKISSTTIARHVGQGQPQFFIGSDGRTSVGGVPQIAIPEGKLGQLEVNGNAYANGNRLAEIPITNDMLGSKCVKSDNIDFAALGGVLVYVARFPIDRRTYNNGYFVFNGASEFMKLNSNIGVTRYNNNMFLRCDLPTDQQFVARANLQLWTPQNSWDYILADLRINGDSFARVMAPRIVGLWGFASTHGWQKVKNGDYFSAYVTTNGNNYADGNMSAKDTFVELEIFRVG